MTILFIAVILVAFGAGVLFMYALHKIDEKEAELLKQFGEEK